MKTLVASVMAVAILGTGCVIHTPGYRRSSSAAVAAPAKNCPPGHRWSDGRCHAKGKGHDR
ncbi:hypothetical protein [Anaeromyxobacter terrae]|uniref:hypothetical protein n=1 Tax=Anaeromyxobacter terrae TaxID=2925406 RepID=UPI001F585112|nr:hypothetical protein [Anaeromyxobacter sp. SG22]